MKRLFSSSGGLSTLLALALAVFAVGTLFADDGNDEGKSRQNNGGEGVGNCAGGNNCVDGVSGSGDETRMSGQVLAINTLKTPNEIVLGNIDGEVYVKLIGKDGPHLVKESGVKVRDYIEVVGWKENENEFYAESISTRDDNNN